MTIRIRVLNDDNRKGAVIRVKQVAPDGREIPGAREEELDSLSCTEMSVHDGASVIVSEVRQP